MVRLFHVDVNKKRKREEKGQSVSDQRGYGEFIRNAI